LAKGSTIAPNTAGGGMLGSLMTNAGSKKKVSEIEENFTDMERDIRVSIMEIFETEPDFTIASTVK
jgi:hypothetical protein